MILSFIESLIQPEHFLMFFSILFIIRFFIFTTLEHYFSAHPFELKKVIIKDLGSMFFYTVLFFPIAQYLSNHIGIPTFIFSKINEIPLLIRVLMYFIVGDFLHYWIHRLMHLPFLWKVHMWHHSPAHMSWMAGFRATILDTTLVNIGFIVAWPLLGTTSDTLKVLLLMTSLLMNDWMHLNISFRMNFLQRFIVTPRYHHIHHSTNKKHYTKNLSPFFPVWDKLFGTYVDPDTVQEKITFGISEKVSPVRLILGV